MTLDIGNHFLSGANPAATMDQRDMETQAIRLAQLPAIAAARAQVAQRWKTIVGRDAPAEAWKRFDQFIDEYAMNYVLKSVNGDPNHPRVLSHGFSQPHEWLGMKVPGSRAGGGDNPDNQYTLIPLDAFSHFEIHGQRMAPSAADIQLSVKGNISLTMTIDNLDGDDLQFEPDGSFVVTIGPESKRGRANHIQTAPEARYLFIRDTRSDWHQVANAYRIKRLDPPTAPPLTEEQIAARAARLMLDDVPALYWWMRIYAGLAANQFMPPFNTGTYGGLVTQMMGFARLDMADDEAFVVTTVGAGACYHSLVIYDYWLCSFDAARQLCSLNNTQAVANADGTTTYVICARDPGTHNWLDSGGLRELRLMHRWQGLPRQADGQTPPSIIGAVVKLSDLDRALPADIRRVTSAERAAQIGERSKTFELRYIDH